MSNFVHPIVREPEFNKDAEYYFALFVDVNTSRGALGPYNEKQHAIDEIVEMQKEPAYVGTKYYWMKATVRKCLEWQFKKFNPPLCLVV